MEKIVKKIAFLLLIFVGVANISYASIASVRMGPFKASLGKSKQHCHHHRIHRRCKHCGRCHACDVARTAPRVLTLTENNKNEISNIKKRVKKYRSRLRNLRNNKRNSNKRKKLKKKIKKYNNEIAAIEKPAKRSSLQTEIAAKARAIHSTSHAMRHHNSHCHRSGDLRKRLVDLMKEKAKKEEELAKLG